jgi:hypothetical protein
MARLTTEVLLDDAFAAVFGTSVDAARQRAAIGDAVEDVVQHIPRELHGLVRDRGPIYVIVDGVSVRCSVPSRSTLDLQLAWEGNSVQVKVAPWRGRSMGTVVSCDVDNLTNAVAMISVLGRAWRRIVSVADPDR